MARDENEQLGPIRPKHARPGWRLEGDGFGRWHLIKHGVEYTARVYGTTLTTCAWSITGPSGRVLREASSSDPDDALDAAEAWWRGER